MNRYAMAFFASTLVLSAGCKSAALRDDIQLDLTFSFAPTLRKPDKLHLPYVSGAKVSVWLEDDDKADMKDWRFETSDPSIFAVTTRDTGIGTMRGDLVARAEGSANLRAFDPTGRLRYDYRIPIAAPDRIELSAHGPLVLHERPENAIVDEARILAGGQATYLVRYFKNGARLYGNGALEAFAQGGFVAEPRRSFLFEEQEWLTLTMTDPGAHSLTLRAGTSTRTVPVAGVLESELSRVVLDGEDEASAKAGTMLSVVATGVDRAGHSVLGVDCSWTMGGRQQSGEGWPWDQPTRDVGDLFRYEFKGNAPKTLVATRNGLEAEAVIHAAVGFVSSTNRIGCAAGGDDAAGLVAAVCVLIAALLVARKQPVPDDRGAQDRERL